MCFVPSDFPSRLPAGCWDGLFCPAPQTNTFSRAYAALTIAAAFELWFSCYQ